VAKNPEDRTFEEALSDGEDEDLFDPLRVLETAIDTGRIEYSSSDIDDRDVERAANAVEWLVDPRFLKVEPYAKQIEDCVFLFSAACFFCVSGDTLIPTNRGMVRLDKLVQERVSAVDTTEGPQACTLWADKGTKPVREVETEAGFTITATPDHKFKCVTPTGIEFLPVSQIKPGSFLLLKKGGRWPKPLAFGPTVVRPRPGRQEWSTLPSRMTRELARLLGYYVSEGHLTDRAYWFANTNPQLLEDFEKCTRVCFGFDPFVDGPRPERAVENRVICKGDVIAFLEQIGLTKERSAKKQVPWSILQSSKEHVIHFLRLLKAAGINHNPLAKSSKMLLF